MEKDVRLFVTKNLSQTSLDYILNACYNINGRIEKRMQSISLPHKNIHFVIGDLCQNEFELYIIMQSLFSRAIGVNRRIQNTEDAPDWLVEERFTRMNEIKSDLDSIRNLLYDTIEKRLKSEIETIFEQYPILIRKRFKLGYMSYKPGYTFVFYREKKVGITNQYPAPGD